MSGTVVVEKEYPRLTFHDPRQMPSTRGMIETSEEKAREDGAVACSVCFSHMDVMRYNYPALPPKTQ
jgi:hypothetical protein